MRRTDAQPNRRTALCRTNKAETSLGGPLGRECDETRPLLRLGHAAGLEHVLAQEERGQRKSRRHVLGRRSVALGRAAQERGQREEAIDELLTLFKREGGENKTVASRQGLGQVMDPTAWNRVALRVKGGEAWLLINDTPVLYTADVIDQSGGIGIALVREGDPEDEEEVVVVFKDLTLSTVAGAEPGRQPSYTAP